MDNNQPPDRLSNWGADFPTSWVWGHDSSHMTRAERIRLLAFCLLDVQINTDSTINVLAFPSFFEPDYVNDLHEAIKKASNEFAPGVELTPALLGSPHSWAFNFGPLRRDPRDHLSELLSGPLRGDIHHYSSEAEFLSLLFSSLVVGPHPIMSAPAQTQTIAHPISELGQTHSIAQPGTVSIKRLPARHSQPTDYFDGHRRELLRQFEALGLRGPQPCYGVMTNGAFNPNADFISWNEPGYWTRSNDLPSSGANQYGSTAYTNFANQNTGLQGYSHDSFSPPIGSYVPRRPTEEERREAFLRMEAQIAAEDKRNASQEPTNQRHRKRVRYNTDIPQTLEVRKSERLKNKGLSKPPDLPFTMDSRLLSKKQEGLTLGEMIDLDFDNRYRRLPAEETSQDLAVKAELTFPKQSQLPTRQQIDFGMNTDRKGKAKEGQYYTYDQHSNASYTSGSFLDKNTIQPMQTDTENMAPSSLEEDKENPLAITAAQKMRIESLLPKSYARVLATWYEWEPVDTNKTTPQAEAAGTEEKLKQQDEATEKNEDTEDESGEPRESDVDEEGFYEDDCSEYEDSEDGASDSWDSDSDE
ncbi:hypothetical protein E8E14_014544 [Neopestalotiopsis sp. 37M]|nr:hypothetical protein E8E14_014544 [Neopestalotiopsis sp. 37M]